MASSSSTELGVAGFRIERELGRGSRAVVYEAIQGSLGRHVALKLLPEDDDLARPLEWPEHPRAVRMYATGPWERGRFVAMQLVPGPSLARLLEAGTLDTARALDLLADVAAALDYAHRTGIAHGDVGARNVLLDGDGRALLSDFGLTAGEPTVAADRADFAGLLADCVGEPVSRLPDPRSSEASELVRLAREQLAPAQTTASPKRRGRLLAAAGVVCLAAAAALAAVLGGSSGDDGVPRPADGARALGSALAPGDIDSVDCSGHAPTGASQACTVVQTRLPGRTLVPPAAGAIRSWVVRGARGELALQVIRARGDRYVSVARTRYEVVPDEGVHVLPANLAVRPGDRIGVQLAPGAAIGVRRGTPGATTARWLGLLFLEPRPIELGAGSGFDHEVLLRVDYARGATPVPAGVLTGRSAARAPAGRELSARTVEVRGLVRRVAVVRLANGIAIDLFAGARRLARVPAPDADPAGRLLAFNALDPQFPLMLRWANPDGRAIGHEYVVGARTLRTRG